MSTYAGIKPYEAFLVPQTEPASGQPVYFFPALAKILTAAEQRIFVAIKSFADYETGYCYPSLTKIADRAGCHRSTVAHTIPRLISKGLLRRHRRLRSDVFTESTNGDCFMSNEYCVNMSDRPWTVSQSEPDAQERHHLELLRKADAKAAEYRQSDRYRANLILRKAKAGLLTEVEALEGMKALLRAPAELVARITVSGPPARFPVSGRAEKAEKLEKHEKHENHEKTPKNAREEIFRVLAANAFSLTREEKKKLANALLEKFPQASAEELGAYAGYLNRVASAAVSGRQPIRSSCGYLLGTIRKLDPENVPALRREPLPAPSAGSFESGSDAGTDADARRSGIAMRKLLRELTADNN